MKEELNIDRQNHIKKDLLGIAILSFSIIVILVILAIIENKTGQISQLAHQLTESLIK